MPEQPNRETRAGPEGPLDETLVRSMIESAPDAFVVVDEAGTMVLVNRQAEVLFGYDRAQLVGEPVELLVPEPLRAAHCQERAAYTRNLTTRPMGRGLDLRGRRADGSEFPVEISLSPLATPGGMLVMSCVRDVTWRVEMEAELRASERRYRTLARATPVGIFRTDPLGSCTYVNERWSEMLGLSSEAASGEGWLRGVHDADRARVAAEWSHMVAECAPLRSEYRAAAGVATVWVLGQAVPERDEDGTLLGFVGTITDITDRKLAEEALRESEQRFRAIFDQEYQFVGLLSRDGTVLEINRTALDAVGIEADEAIGRPFWETRWWSGTQDRERLQRAIEAAAGGEFVRFEAEHRGADGEAIIVDFSIKPVRDDAGDVVFVLPEGRDITEMKRAQQALTDLAEELTVRNAELDRSNRDLDDFAYIASHDLKEPLRGISNYAAFLIEDEAKRLSEEGRRMARPMVRAIRTMGRLCERLEALIDSLLRYSRVGRGEASMAETDLNEVVAETLEGLQVTLREASVDVVIPRPLPRVRCDATSVGEIYQNLITNAAKYHDGDRKRVELGFRDPEAGAGDGPVLFVRDDGIGIAEKHLDGIFGMFKRLHGREKYGGGTGAGLSIVRKIVERHGGRIWVESTPGEGSTFAFTLGPTEPAAD